MKFTETEKAEGIVSVTCELDESELPRELSSKTIVDRDFKGATITWYWDSHGHKVKWDWNGKNSKSWSNCHVRIVEREMAQKFEHIPEYHYTVWDLYINGTKIDMGEIASYSWGASQRITIRSCAGAG